MTTPKHLITQPDGRVTAVDEVGPADGPAVVLLHCSPGSRLLDPDPGVTAARGVRLITLDRAGYGGSDAFPADRPPTLADFADDTAVVLDALGVARAAVAGWSAGGRAALGLAARRPDLVGSLALLSAPAKHTDVPWIPEQFHGLLPQIDADPAAAYALIAGILGQADPAEQELGMAFGEADDALLADPVVEARCRALGREGLRNGPWGVAADIVAANRPDAGYDLTSVGPTVQLFYGDADPGVTTAHGEFFADTLPSAELHVVEGAGHLLPLLAWDAVLKSLVLG